MPNADSWRLLLSLVLPSVRSPTPQLALCPVGARPSDLSQGLLWLPTGSCPQRAPGGGLWDWRDSWLSLGRGLRMAVPLHHGGSLRLFPSGSASCSPSLHARDGNALLAAPGYPAFPHPGRSVVKPLCWILLELLWVRLCPESDAS